MRCLMWQRVMSLSLFALLAMGLGDCSRADDADAHAETAHAADHDHPHAADDHHAAGGVADAHGDHAAAGGHIDTSKPPIEPNEQMAELFVFSLIFFVLYLVVAKKTAWLPLIAGLDARESRVNRALADAEAARIEATKLLADHQKHLDKVTDEVKDIIAQARGSAEQEKARIIAEAEAETTRMRDEAIADIHAARAAALSGLDERIDSQVTTATEHILG